MGSTVDEGVEEAGVEEVEVDDVEEVDETGGDVVEITGVEVAEEISVVSGCEEGASVEGGLGAIGSGGGIVVNIFVN